MTKCNGSKSNVESNAFNIYSSILWTLTSLITVTSPYFLNLVSAGPHSHKSHPLLALICDLYLPASYFHFVHYFPWPTCLFFSPCVRWPDSATHFKKRTKEWCRRNGDSTMDLKYYWCESDADWNQGNPLFVSFFRGYLWLGGWRDRTQKHCHHL